jgi:hypothetical protein
MALALPVMLGACADGQFGTVTAPREAAVLTPVQDCAVGYDLARYIYETAKIDGTAVRVSETLGMCGQYAARYLRKAGFAVSEDGKGANQFLIDTYDLPNGSGFVATASLPGLKVTRAYRRADGGVYALSPASLTRVVEPN